jgi:D-amino-acid dehydrogenase
MSKIAIVGSGIAGITTAYYLRMAGYDVDVFDEEKYPAMKCSYANGGQISVSNSEVWTTWSNVFKGLKWMLKKDAPLLIRPSLDLDKAIWLGKFLYNTYKGTYQENTAKTIYMGLESRKLYSQLIYHLGLNFDKSDSGILHFYKDPRYWEQAISAKQIYDDNNCRWDLLDPEATYAIDPNIKNIKNILGGAWTEDDWVGDIHKFCTNLADYLKLQGVNFFFDVKLDSITELLHYDKIVVCAGVGSVRLAKTAGDRLPIYPVKGYSITINGNDPKLLPKVSLLDDQAKIVTSTLGNRFRVAGTAEFAGENYDIRRDRIEPLLKWVHENFPQIDTSNYSSWACLRPMTPNMIPITKQSDKHKKVYYNTGHGHLGWTLAPYTATQITRLINGSH